VTIDIDHVQAAGVVERVTGADLRLLFGHPSGSWARLRAGWSARLAELENNDQLSVNASAANRRTTA
jgi:hypothetical protein